MSDVSEPGKVCKGAKEEIGFCNDVPCSRNGGSVRMIVVFIKGHKANVAFSRMSI